MRAPVVIVLVLAAVAAAAAWLLSGGGDAPGPAVPEPPAPVRTPEPIAPAEHGSRVEPPTPPRPPAAGNGGDRAPGEQPPVDPAPVPPNVVLAVRGLATREPVAAFRWQFRNSRVTARGEGTDGRAELTLEPSASGELLVEAEGFAPWNRSVAAPVTQAPALQLDVFLGPAVPAAGITLHVRDLSLQPIANVRVDAFALAQPPPRDWHLGPSLWARRTNAPDGRYPLPPLPPGDYGIRVVATDADGLPLPLLPYRNTFTLTGDNGFVEDVPLAPGALLALDLADANGAPLDPARVGTTLLSLIHPGGPPVARKWTVRTGSAEASAIDAVPGVGRVLLADAVEAGPYQLEVRVGGLLRVQRPLFLRPGLTNEERVAVP